MSALKNVAYAIIITGFMYGLPEINTLFVDFTQFGSTTILLIRAGLLVLMIYFLTKSTGKKQGGGKL